MPPAARVGDSTAHGGVITVGSSSVMIGNMPAARLGDMHTCPMSDPGPKPHIGGPIITSSQTVKIEFALAARLGDQAGCNTVGISGVGVPPVCGPSGGSGGAQGAPPDQWSWDLDEAEGAPPQMDADLDPQGHVRGPHLEAETFDASGDGEHDSARTHGSVARGRAQGEQELGIGGLAVGGRVYGDYLWVDGEAGIPGTGSSHARGDVGGARGGGELYLGPAGDGGRNAYVAVGAEGDIFHAEARGDFLVGDDGERAGARLGGKLGAEVFGGKVTGRTTIPLWGGWNIQTRTEVSGSAVTVGIGGGAHAFWNRKEERFHLGAFGSVAALLGAGLNLDISIGKAYAPPSPSTCTQAPGVPGSGSGGIPDPIVSGEPTVLIG